MRFLEELQKKLASVPEQYLMVNVKEVQPGEKVVGKLPKDLVRFFGLMNQSREEINEMQLEHAAAHENAEGDLPRETCQTFHAQMDRKTIQLKAFTAIFWASVQTELNVTGQNLGIRGDGDVVAFDEEENGEGFPFGGLLSFLSARRTVTILAMSGRAD